MGPAEAPDPPPPEDGSERPSLGERARRFWKRHRTLFWSLHSLWALATGVVVILLARERYGFVPWVLAFLGATWASTMFFGRRVVPAETGVLPPFGHEVTSYLTRTLYQETLFFLLPFYAYSTVVMSPNVVFPALLVALAVVSCLDLVFDRWLRASPVFGVVFFAAVAFAAINLLLPVLVGLSPRFATPLAAGLAVGSALPLVFRLDSMGRAGKLRAGLAAAIIVVAAVALPVLVPPVPLRMESASFAAGIDRETLDLVDPVEGSVSSARLGSGVVVLVEVFAPTSLPTRVRLEWVRDGRLLRTSREVDIVAHGAGFRVWDALRDPDGLVESGRYEVVLKTAQGRIFGRSTLAVVGD